ncbi:SMP-30/gluconolactonase/LRE family protein [Colwelliaceae bacterium BS250]
MSKVTIGNLIKVIDVANTLGEGVQWHALSQCIWWTDIQESCLYCYCTQTTQLIKHDMPERVGCFAFIKDDPRIIVAFASGIALYHLQDKTIEWLDRPERHLPNNRFNDGRVDRQGRFWVGSMIENFTGGAQSSSLYLLDKHQKGISKISGIEISNGLCWSPDGSKLYHADSPKRQINQYDFNSETGEVSNRKHFATTEYGSFPDGSAVDAQGFLWNAQWAGSRVIRYAPNGQVDTQLYLPVSQPSCVAIGGPNLDWLIITSARQDLAVEQLSSQPQAGNVFIYQLNGVQGIEENQCVLS